MKADSTATPSARHRSGGVKLRQGRSKKSDSSATAAKYGIAEYLVATAAPPATPDNTARHNECGCSTHMSHAAQTAMNVASNGTSVVARPACATTAGTSVKITTENAALSTPPNRLPHHQTIQHASRKNGKTPRRASVRFCSYPPPVRITALASRQTCASPTVRAPVAYGPIAIITRAS